MNSRIWGSGGGFLREVKSCAFSEKTVSGRAHLADVACWCRRVEGQLNVSLRPCDSLKEKSWCRAFGTELFWETLVVQIFVSG